VEDHPFFPISNSEVVNLDFVDSYQHRERTVRLTTGETVYTSRWGGRRLKELFDNQVERTTPANANALRRLIKQLLRRLLGE